VNLNFKKENILISRGLSTQIFKSGDGHAMYATYYLLKAMYVGGSIHNFSSRNGEISKLFGIGSSTLRKYVSQLKEKGLVKKEGVNLIIVKKDVLKDSFNTSKLNVKVLISQEENKCTVGYLKNVFEAIAINESIEKKEFIYKKKVIKKICVDKKIYTENESKIIGRKTTFKLSKGQVFAQNKEIKKLNDDFEQILQKNQQRFVQEVKNTLISEESEYLSSKKLNHNPFFSPSRKNISNIFGKKSKSTGTRRINKLKKNGFINSDISNTFVLTDQPLERSLVIDLNSNNDFGFIFNKGNKSFIKLNNVLEVNPNSFIY
jgi:DNA-binding Lrp family transcriptional regulator